MNDLWRLSAQQLAEGYGQGAFTPGEVLEACLARIAETRQEVNAVVLTDRIGAKLVSSASRLRWARGKTNGPLDGVPVSLGDDLHAAGLHTAWGSLLLKDFVARKDEAAVTRLRAGGAMVIGKTNLPEFSIAAHCANPVHGVTRNPWEPALTPGACGGAAAVAAGCGPLALATDAGGSLREAASHCGVVGFKPSHAVQPEDGLPALLLDFETLGALARTVDDAWLLAQVASGVPAQLLGAATPARILYVPRCGDQPVDPAVAERMGAAVKQFEALGHTVTEAASFEAADPVNASWPLLAATGLAWMLSEAGSLAEFGLRVGEAPNVTLCSPEVQDSLRDALESDAASLFELFAATRVLKRELAALLAQHDFILTPACAALPWPADEPAPARNGAKSMRLRAQASFSLCASVAGLPAVVVPCGMADGLPVGLQLVGRAGADATLMALARHYEQAHPWADRWPELQAAAAA